MTHDIPHIRYPSNRISEDLQKLISGLEQNYHIESRIFNTTVVRDVKGDAKNAYTEIKGLVAKSLDGKLRFALDFSLEHETPKDENRVIDIAFLPNTREVKERVIRDISANYSKYKA